MVPTTEFWIDEKADFASKLYFFFCNSSHLDKNACLFGLREAYAWLKTCPLKTASGLCDIIVKWCLMANVSTGKKFYSLTHFRFTKTSYQVN
jgi:hypothetical protein